MIRYALKCTQGHSFETWFQSADAFQAQSERGLVSCAVCGSSEVEKALMAPKVGGLSEPATALEGRIAALRRKVEAEATYVGGRFAAEARAIHEHKVPDRAIYGEANAAEIKGLLEDGVPVAPLPFRPKAKAN